MSVECLLSITPMPRLLTQSPSMVTQSRLVDPANFTATKEGH